MLEARFALPNPPVIRLPQMMCNRNYFDFFVAEPVDETERKVRKEVSAGITQITWPPVRSFFHPLDAGVYLSGKGSGGRGLRTAYHRTAASTSAAATG